MASDSFEILARIAGRFVLEAPVASIAPLGNGNVNDTYRVCLEGDASPDVVLQRLNTRVFPHPELVMENMRRCCEHVRAKLLQGTGPLGTRRWEVPRVYRTRIGGHPWVEAEGGFWRAISYIGASRSFDTIRDGSQAREVGLGLGMFHALISDLPVADLADTLEGFHITPTYLEAFDRALERSAGGGAATGSPLHVGLEAVQRRRALVPVLEQAKASGRLCLRPIHGDPKINNLLMDSRSGRAIALIDLDTVKPGLVQYDIGDCLRSGCNGLGEETTDWPSVRFDAALCRELLEGYVSVARSFLREADFDHLFDAIRLIPFELGLRFLTDHLCGNPYFKTSRPDHNLTRALVQFQLTESIEAQEGDLRRLIDGLRPPASLGARGHR